MRDRLTTSRLAALGLLAAGAYLATGFGLLPAWTSLLAQRLKTATRAGDVVARYGGEEFVLLLAHAGPEATVAVAERIRATVADQPIPMGDGPPQPVTVSVGAAWMPGPAQTSARLMLQADHCPYAAKARGRNRVMATTGV